MDKDAKTRLGSDRSTEPMLRGGQSENSVSVPSLVIVGLMASGKGTYASALKHALESEFGVSVHRTPSSSVVIADIAREYFFAEDGPDGKPDRTLMQEIGTKMCEIRPGVFANYIVHYIKTNKLVPFISEGLRSAEDIMEFRQGFPFPRLLVVRIEAEEAKRMEVYKEVYGRYPTREQIDHPSERSVAGICADITLENSYSRGALAVQVDSIIAAIRDNKFSDLLRK